MAGDYEGALAEYERFVERHPDDRLAPLAALSAGNLRFEILKDGEGAAALYDRVIRDYPSSRWAVEAACRKGEALRDREKWLGAGLAFEKAVDLAAGIEDREIGGSVTDAMAAAADCYFQLGDNDRVLDLYRKVLDSSPLPATSATALARMGEAYEATGRPALAAASYVRVLNECPCASREALPKVLQKRAVIDEYASTDWAPYETYDQISLSLRRRDLAGALEKSLEVLNQPAPPALLECAEYMSIRLGNAVSAEFGSATDRLRDYRARYPRGQVAVDADQTLDLWTEVLDAEARVAENPEDAAGLATLGTLYMMSGCAQASRAALEIARDLDPEGFFGSRYALGYVYAYLGQTEAAIREFEIHLESYPSDNQIRVQIGRLYMSLEAWDRAIEHYRWMVRTAPWDPNAHISLGQALFRAGQMDEAGTEYEKAVELSPAFPAPHFFLGQIYGKTGQDAKARAAYERFLELSPTGPQADEARAALEALRAG
jgi:tetratricopeptide (TPR) repeat protein